MSSMKGLLKGLRYISQIFENEKEEEMQIGHPTDVKHVAHIGMDGSSSTKPSWMNEFTAKENSTTSEASSKPPPKPSTHDPVLTRDISEVQMLTTGPSESPSRQSKPKQSTRRHHSSSSSPIGSPSRDPDKPRKHKTSGDLGSPAREPGTRTRRIHNSNLGGSESPAHDKPSVPKSRRKKSKESIGSVVGSNRSSKSKVSHGMGGETTFHSDPGSGGGGYGLNNNNPVLKVYDEGNECEDISRGIRTM